MTVTFKDVKADLLDQIARGALQPGSLIPGETDLAEKYGCARATVNRAMRELAEEGIVERKRKAGTRVRMSPIRHARFSIPIVREEIEASGAVYRYALIEHHKQEAPDWLRGRLALASGQMAVHVICMHWADGIPYQHEDRWINPEIVPSVLEADFSVSSPNEWLLSEVPFSNAEICFTAVEADRDLADHLGCIPGNALFRTERTTWLRDGAITLVRLTNRPGHRMTTRY
ncbi:HTH-type transcriptional repressor YvoA (plasmid) [Sulfitobacter sp. THAF37]|uniref:GntR family transcriptional regulator n=1 Tax=Sulfitobacter sp. THAF37 TaxID=2587855 RepID=UPI0012688D2B|nr:GntR family transcriptional regulator [Sulfitobacter sp. THAF37]QFT60740.1 HTH-type transcriptional repressor YvoA [Sulfitobacter sp. THAF37]